jgi:uncharacterized protein
VLAAVRGLAQRRGFAHVATGTHLDDRRASHRPGLRAAAELGVCEPLAEVGATKEVVRLLAARWNLTVQDKPSTPCLAGVEGNVPGLLPLDAPDQLGQLGMVSPSQQPAIAGIGGPFVDNAEGHVHSNEVLTN